MQKFIEWIISLFKKPDPVTPPTPDPDPEPKPHPDPDPTPDNGPSLPDATPLHAPVFTTAGCALITKPEDGFVNNPANARGTLKIILPGKYSGKIVRVVMFTDAGFRDITKRGPSNEYAKGGGPRQRYYGTLPVDNYPQRLWVRWDCNENGVAKDYCFQLANPKARIG